MANLNNPAVKRIMGELKELTQGARPDDQFVAAPLEDNLFEWHFSIRGPAATAFDGGVYHGKIILPSEYPFKPPSITLLTPNGRFEVGKKICLSVSAHHPEHWQPAWGIRTIITALIAFMPTKAEGALAGLDYTNEERRELAIRSQAWACPSCGVKMCEALPARPATASASMSSEVLPAVPTELRFGYEPNAPATGADEGGVSNALPAAASEAASPEPAARACARASAAGGGVREGAATPLLTTTTTQPPPHHEQGQGQSGHGQGQRQRQRQREQPQVAGALRIALAIFIAIVALVIRKSLRNL